MRWHFGTLLAAPLMLGSAADAQMLRCSGDLVFEDAMARRVTLWVDPDEGSVKNPACHKYPELRKFADPLEDFGESASPQLPLLA